MAAKKREPFDHIAYNSDPISHLKRALAKADIHKETLSHVLCWAKRVIAKVPPDPRSRAVAQTAILAYVQLARLQLLVLSSEPASDVAEKAANLTVKWNAVLVRALRVSGMATGVAGGKVKSAAGKGFTPPRAPVRSQLDETGAPMHRDDMHQDYAVTV